MMDWLDRAADIVSDKLQNSSWKSESLLERSRKSDKSVRFFLKPGLRQIVPLGLVGSLAGWQPLNSDSSHFEGKVQFRRSVKLQRSCRLAAAGAAAS